MVRERLLLPVARDPAIAFSAVFHLTPELPNERYFGNRSDGPSAPRLAQMLFAQV